MVNFKLRRGISIYFISLFLEKLIAPELFAQNMCEDLLVPLNIGKHSYFKFQDFLLKSLNYALSFSIQPQMQSLP